MNCNGCDACCLGQNIPVSAAAGDRVSSDFVDQYGCLKQIEARCVFFNTDSRLCDYYPNCPRACVRFLPGSARCLYVRLWVEVRFDWFNPERKPVPSETEIRAAFESVMNNEDMSIVSIPDIPKEYVQQAIARYNEAIRLTDCF